MMEDLIFKAQLFRIKPDAVLEIEIQDLKKLRDYTFDDL